VSRSRAEQKVVEKGYDPARRPVLHAGSVPGADLATWDLRIWGDVDSPITLAWERFRALPSTEVTTDIHCVTRWSRFDARFKGVHWRELAALVRPTASARFVVAHAEHGYTTNVPLEALEAEDALLAYEADGEPLAPDHGWPLRLVVPSRYFWKSAKWLRGLELSNRDRPGYWEKYGYHMNADYRDEERYGF
jgi:DMSO/TMAO reductase YedYZ molybdopterin-dependent catalytic subunit